jgi:hypothetical protein
MSRLVTAFVCLSLVSVICLTACAPGEPVLPSEAIEKIKARLGYALAPTYLPEGFEYDPGIGDPGTVSIVVSTSIARQMYKKEVTGEETIYLAMNYPSTSPTTTSFEERIGAEVPEDAISEIDINGMTAYLYNGSWSADTLRRIARVELPINPEWDYDGGTSIRFAIDVPDNERVWVDVRTVLPTDEVTDKDLIRIARSVIVVE